jgi:hypothetical protein
MSANVEIMAASFEVIIQRARERNPDLPIASFRCSAGNFYKYLIQICDRWNHEPWSLHYLKMAICANPSFLLETWPFKRFIKISLRAITTSAWKFLTGFVSKAILESIELGRLSALRDQDGTFLKDAQITNPFAKEIAVQFETFPKQGKLKRHDSPDTPSESRILRISSSGWEALPGVAPYLPPKY